MRITPMDIEDDTQIDDAFALTEIVERHDTPDLPAPCPIAFRAHVRDPRVGVKMGREIARIGDVVVGAVQVFMPTSDNLGLAGVHVLVHPEHRRRGIGTALLERGLEIARENGRTQITGGSFATRPEGGPTRSEGPHRFCEKHGFAVALQLVDQVLDLDSIDEADERRLHAEAMEKSADYETISWVDTTPEEMLLPVAALQSTFLVEAPMGDIEFEEETLDPDRIRKNEANNVGAGLTVFTVVARRRGDTELAAITKIGVRTNPGDHGGQWITLASPRHRGKRLGLRVKLENHRLLRATLPRVRYLHTDNAGVNGPMLRVNELLGYQATDQFIEYKRVLSA